MELDGSDIAIAHRYVLFNLAITESFLKWVVNLNLVSIKSAYIY